MEVSVVINDDLQKERIMEALNGASHTLQFIDSRGKEKKNAWALKSHWGAKEEPFAIVMDGDKAVKAFYSEASDVVKELIDYLNEQDISNR